jgi:chromosome partitioning protein
MTQSLSGPRIVALINQKGGVGKTTCTANLGACLALAKRRVLVMDLDPQSHLTIHLGANPHELETTLYDALRGDCALAETLLPTPVEGLTLAPASLALTGLEIEMASAVGREIILRELVAPHRQEYDYILIDCPPSLGILTLNALTTASEVFIVLQTEFFALEGTSRLIETVDIVHRRLNKNLHVTGVIACLFDRRKNICKEVYSNIREYFHEIVFHTPIRTNVALTEAPSYGLPVCAYAPDSNGAHDFGALAREVIKREPRRQPTPQPNQPVEEETPCLANA